MQITPNLRFDGQAEEAARFYTSLFKDLKVEEVARYNEAAAEASGRPEGSAMTVAFQLAGQDFVGLNGEPHFTFTPAISFFVTLETEAKVDALWEGPSAGTADKHQHHCHTGISMCSGDVFMTQTRQFSTGLG